MQINGKELRIVTTVGFREAVSMMEAQLYISIVNVVLKDYPVDMLIFEYKDGIQTVRSGGYLFNDPKKLDETTILYSAKSLPTKTFWLKIEYYDYYHEKYYLGTFLLPEEY